MIVAVSDFVGMLIALPLAALMLYVAFRLLISISKMQGRKSFDDRSNSVGRMLTAFAGAVFGRHRH